MTIRQACLVMALGFSSATFAADKVACKDGTTADAGRGACSRHGGVDKKTSAKAAKAHPEDKKPSTRATPRERGSPAMVTCKDGTASKGGRGACRGHGGIARASDSRAAPGAPSVEARAPVTAPAPRHAGSAPSAARGRGSDDTDPGGAIAQCRDGTYSHAKSHSGACSRHGGVAEWLDGSK